MHTCDEFKPYVLQIMNQMLRLSPPPVADIYQKLLGSILVPSMWSDKGTVHASTNMLHTFMQKDFTIITNDKTRMMTILGIYSNLLNRRGEYPEYAFKLLRAMVKFIPIDNFKEHLPQCFKLIFTRLSKGKEQRFCHG